MREITYYIANDGKQFDNEDECLEYEHNLAMKEYHYVLLDFYKQPTENWEMAFYCYISAETDACELSKKELEWSGTEIPRECGFWLYDSECGNWITLEKKRKELVDELDDLYELEKKLKMGLGK